MAGKSDNLNDEGNIMALNKSTPTPKFESGEGEGSGEDTQVLTPAQRLQAAADKRAAEQKQNDKVADKPADAPADAPASASKAVAITSGNAVAKPTAMINPLEPLKNAFFCEFDTLRGLKVSNGNVVDNQTGKSLGDVVGMELLSYQDQWVVSPGVDGDEGKEHVRYSDDGITTSKGENCQEYLQHLKSSGFDEAKMSKRTVIAGSLFDIGVKGRKDLKDMQDELVQMSLAPTSKAGFDRYMMGQAFKIGKGLITPDGATRIRITCEAVTKNGKDWTMALFSRYDEPVDA